MAQFRKALSAQTLFTPIVTMLIAAGLSACGGGDGNTTPKTAISRVKVMGDSLADSGTYGFKFTVQDPSNPKGFPTWPEKITATYGAPALCNVFQFNGTSFTEPAAGCTNYAVGGATINNPAAKGGAAVPSSILMQIKTAGNVGFSASELLLIDGGGNDAADLIGAYLAASRDSGAALVTLTTTLLPLATVQTTLSQPDGAAALGSLYMSALADKFASEISSNLLEKGATRIAIMNMPTVSNTPKIGIAFGRIATAKGGGEAGAQAVAAAKVVFDTWVKAFNNQLALKFAGNGAVTIADFGTTLANQVADPAPYGLTNSTAAACPSTGTSATGAPTYSLKTCLSTALDTSNPTWKTHAFADDFHPTPYGHQFLAQLITIELAKKGWL